MGSDDRYDKSENTTLQFIKLTLEKLGNGCG